jgi:hypothetical protein
MLNTIAINMWLTREFKSTKGDINSREALAEGSIDIDFMISTNHGSTWSHMLEKHTRGDQSMTRAMIRWLLADLIPILEKFSLRWVEP